MLNCYTNNMKNNKSFIYILIIFFVISINSIYSFTSFLTKDVYSLIIRQCVFYIVGILLIIILLKTGPDVLLKYSFWLYIINLILLFLVLVFGTEVNGTKAWFSVPLIGTFQPSEFMKIGLILYLSKVINSSKLKTTIDEALLIIKCLIITIIPSIVTFLEPDTGAVLIYFIILFVMLFSSNVRIRWFIALFIIFASLIGFIFYLYTFQTNTFIEVFGSSMFYRLDRIFDWKSSSGMQLENSIIAISSSGYFGKGIGNIMLYFPEGHTDFIFSSFASIYGLVGMIILIVTIAIFDIVILNTKFKKSIYKYITIGALSSVLYQQIQNISMTIGLMPITGITLPFISYGGSSLISYMILLGIVMSIRKKQEIKFY